MEKVDTKRFTSELLQKILLLEYYKMFYRWNITKDFIAGVLQKVLLPESYKRLYCWNISGLALRLLFDEMPLSQFNNKCH